MDEYGFEVIDFAVERPGGLIAAVAAAATIVVKHGERRPEGFRQGRHGAKNAGTHCTVNKDERRSAAVGINRDGRAVS